MTPLKELLKAPPAARLRTCKTPPRTAAGAFFQRRHAMRVIFDPRVKFRDLFGTLAGCRRTQSAPVFYREGAKIAKKTLTTSRSLRSLRFK